MDLETGEELLWGQEGYTVSEAVFVAHPDASTEDHGKKKNIIHKTHTFIHTK